MPDASAHRLGFAVKTLGEGGLPSHDTRRWSSGPHLRHSLAMFREVVAYLDRHDLRMYRMASALAPYASHPDLPQFHDQVRECEQELGELGRLVRAAGIRLSTHPGQYTVLNSEDPAVQAAAAAELEVQASVLDAMRHPSCLSLRVEQPPETRPTTRRWEWPQTGLSGRLAGDFRPFASGFTAAHAFETDGLRWPRRDGGNYSQRRNRGTA